MSHSLWQAPATNNNAAKQSIKCFFKLWWWLVSVCFDSTSVLKAWIASREPDFHILLQALKLDSVSPFYISHESPKWLFTPESPNRDKKHIDQQVQWNSCGKKCRRISERHVHREMKKMDIYEGCSKFFHLENAIFAKKKITFAELSRTPCLSFAVHVGQDFEEKRGCQISSNCSRRLIPRHTSFCGSCT